MPSTDATTNQASNVVPIVSFRKFWELGYRRLVPIVPVGAEISPKSSLYRRSETGKSPIGKAPGVLGQDGKWRGYDWLAQESDEDDIVRWQAMGAGVGIKMGAQNDGQWLVAIDADTKDESHARAILEVMRERLPLAPVRIGRYPKALYLVKCSEPYNYTRIEFGRDDRGLAERVEILSAGRQAVAAGIHPETLQPYTWPRGLPSYSDLPTVDAAALDGLLGALASVLPAASPLIREGATDVPDQATLAGALETVRAAVAATPNTTALFPTRESYRDFGYMIKASLPDHPNEAFEIFENWCDRWDDPAGNLHETVVSDWARMKPPFKAGASKLYETCEQASGGAFNTASAWFEPLAPTVESVWPTDVGIPTTESAAIRATPYRFPDPTTFPRRSWLYGGHYIRRFLSSTVAPSGVGKSSLNLVEALAMASGKPLLGVQPCGKYRVWVWNGEDPLEELERRVMSAMQHYGLTESDIEDRLMLNSGRDMELILATQSRDGALISKPVVGGLIEAIQRHSIDVTVIDPFVASHRVSENDNGAIDMVAKQFAKIADITNSAIELVHHVRKLNGAEITVEDGRGAVALLAAVRSARSLDKLSKKDADALGLEAMRGRLFRFGDGKNNLAPPIPGADEQWLELTSVSLPNGEGVGIEWLIDGDNVGVVRRFTGQGEKIVATGDEEAIRAAIGTEEWRYDIRAGDAWIGAPIMVALGYSKEDKGQIVDIKRIIEAWLKSGQLVRETRKDAHRMLKTFVRLADKLSENVFE